jgi:hypothetical protein
MDRLIKLLAGILVASLCLMGIVFILASTTAIVMAVIAAINGEIAWF